MDRHSSFASSLRGRLEQKRRGGTALSRALARSCRSLGKDEEENDETEAKTKTKKKTTQKKTKTLQRRGNETTVVA